jgi:uncharacterized protein
MTDVDPHPDAEVSAVGDPTPLEVLDLSPEQWRIVAVAGVEMDLPSANPEVVLHEAQDPWRELRIPVGLAEGTAIAAALRRMDSPRPLTHELFSRVLQQAGIDVIALRLVGREDGVYLAELDLMTPTRREQVDCRPSDGLVLALRMPVPAPVLVDERLLETSGDVLPLGPDPG